MHLISIQIRIDMNITVEAYFKSIIIKFRNKPPNTFLFKQNIINLDSTSV